MRHGFFGHHGHGHGGGRFARGGFGEDREHGERRHRGAGRFGIGRFLEHGDLRLVVLQLVAEKPRHGYDIIKAIEEKAGGAYTPSPGVVYPTLTLLEELGHITVSQGDGPRKLHTITEEGQAFLETNRGALDAVLARFEEAGAEGGRGPQILRAMLNLKMALRFRLARGRLDAEQVGAIAAAIDAAATTIERI